MSSRDHSAHPAEPLVAPVARVERVVRPLRTFLARESASGALLVIASVAALVWANSPWRDSYHDLWGTELGISLGDHALRMDLHHWVNDGVMVIFFFVVGLEIKRELAQGELRDPRAAALPAIAALGGMVVPAALFAVIAIGGDGAHGWGIPMATDIAMALGVLALAGSRVVPPALALFLLALAIVDDIGAILVIAVFYSDGIDGRWLLTAGLCVAAVLLLRAARIAWTPAYVAVGVAMWFATHEAGVHATLAGVVLGLLAPTTPYIDSGDLDDADVVDLHGAGAARSTAVMARHSISVVERLEYLLHPWSSYAIVPLFALANAGIEISGESLGDAVGSRVVWGVIVGLVVGKPLGITLATWIATRSGLASLPPGIAMTQIAAVGVVAGIGFTVSLFVADLAYAGEDVLDAAKLAVLAASTVAGLTGLAVLRAIGRRGDVPTVAP